MKIAFRVDSNRLSGFGHFSRLLNLCRTWSAMKLLDELLFVGNYSSFALDLLNYYKINFKNIETDDFSNLHLELLNSFDIVVYDSYFLNGESIKLIADQAHKSIIIDDECKYNYSGIDIVVNFRFDAEKLYNYNSKHQFLGIKYFIVKPELETIRNFNTKKPREDLKNLLIFLGGNFSNSFIIQEIISRINSLKPDINIFLISKELNRLEGNYTQLEPTFNIEEILKKVDVVISGGGITKYEAGYSLIPTASFSNTILQYEDSLILEKYNANFNLGMLDNNEGYLLLKNLDDFLCQDYNRIKQIEANRFNYDQTPTKNLINKISEL